ncbi:MAG: hypothetical protein JJ974_03925 [Phycisphaerales bacterium]|nr:hypothetical protein [Phycisphaerales bacterium]
MHRSVITFSALLAASIATQSNADIAQLDIVSLATNGPWEGSVVTLTTTLDLDQDFTTYNGGDSATFSTLQTSMTIDFDGDADTMDDIVVLGETGRSILDVSVGPFFSLFQIWTPQFDGGVWDTSSDPNFGLNGYNVLDFPFSMDPLDEEITGPLRYLELIDDMNLNQLGSLRLNDQYSAVRTTETTLTIIPTPASLGLLSLAGLSVTRRKRTR